MAVQLDTTQVQLDATQWCGALSALAESVTNYRGAYKRNLKVARLGVVQEEAADVAA